MIGWWAFSQRALEALTTPTADVAACDRAMEQLARDSRLGGMAHRASWTIRSAWQHSLARSIADSLRGDLAGVQGVRLGGWMTIVVGAIVLGLNAIKPTPAGPLSSLVPSLVVAAGVLLMLIAAPLTRAAADRRSRHTADKVS